MSLDRMEGGMLDMAVYAVECLRNSFSGVSIDGRTDSFSSDSIDPSASYGEGELPRSCGMLESESEYIVKGEDLIVLAAIVALIILCEQQ